MKKKNRGFTLIELLIAIAVLSIMAGALFQIFAVSGKLGAKARKSEVVLDMAKKTMEELKGYSFETLDRLIAEPETGETSGTVIIAGTTYAYEPLPQKEDGTAGEGYLLTTTGGVSTNNPGTAKYLICAEADRGIYSDDSVEAKDKAYSINKYQMPNIVDVSSFQNIVLEPQMIVKDESEGSGDDEGGVAMIKGDALRVAELLLKVNPEEDNLEEDNPEAEESAADDEPAEVFDEGDVIKYIHLNLKEKPGEEDKPGQLLAEASAVYTVDSKDADTVDELEPAESLTFSLSSFNKRIVTDEKTGRPINRIYVFLPETDNAEFKKIFVTTDVESDFELYVVAANGYEDSNVEYISIIAAGGESDTIELYTNLNGKRELVSDYPEKDRLYHLTVTVYEADYSAGSGTPKPGEKLFTLDSSKAE